MRYYSENNSPWPCGFDEKFPRSCSSYLRAKKLVDENFCAEHPTWFHVPVNDARLMDFTLSFIELYCADSFGHEFVTIPCYNRKKVFAFDTEEFMKHAIIFEIPYGHRSKYFEMLNKINARLPIQDCMTLFVNNVPYDLHFLVSIETTDESVRDFVCQQISSLKLFQIHSKGMDELFRETAARKWNIRQPWPGQADIEFQVAGFFSFPEVDELKQKGYDLYFQADRPRLFISYCHTDKALVYDFTERMESCGIDFWIDKKDLESGKPLLRSILQGISECDIAISFVSKAMVHSNFAQAELEHILDALIKKEKMWCFVRVDDVDVNSVMPCLSTYTYIDYAAEHDLDAVVKDVLTKHKRAHEAKLGYSVEL
ncbi:MULTISPECIES: toll/interleukin-1 receptor domain-containing protein [Caproicibacterium]|uniref:Toll/interleukin-1 receptor domain-containing protein n=1 Tax=Caproicibacterium argilliputei TaxID=3030016 RepID=A0AA97H3J6_9FIRM|nr:toll/interleukin-1 receptor domain-containing protein [Caproicibacterium argilliputei]WOC32358.1 toll/interleukin-1 receptor domain-containing protein [Caproicibacterium argilliputei]